MTPPGEAGHERAGPARPVPTNWDAYYRHPGMFTPLTRRTTARSIEKAIGRFGAPPVGHIAELGAGNSVFLRRLASAFPDARLTAVDMNAEGLRLLESTFGGNPRLTIDQRDVLADAPPLGADIVFSVGLIEHFDERLTARAIERHFAHVRPGGLVVVTFPTATWLYRLVRGAAETAGLWMFPDERPLSADEVLREVMRHGKVLDLRINWAVVLTQGVVVARRAPISADALPGSSDGA